MSEFALVMVLTPIAFGFYCWLVYPLALCYLGREEKDAARNLREDELPAVAVLIATHNAGARLRETLNALLDDDYPVRLLSIYVVSDASTDDTVRIVSAFRPHQVTLIQSRRRCGKTRAENLAARYINSEIVVCTDANVQVERGSIRALVQALARPGVGVASGTDVGICAGGAFGIGERMYIRAEMWLRRKESHRLGLVGASGCLYAMRRSLFVPDLNPSLTRDFASVLLARKVGLRSVAVSGAMCRVHSSSGPRAEYSRKVRTIVQGLETLAHFKEVMNPVIYGPFAFALISHKLCRWLLPLSMPFALGGGLYLIVSEADTAVTSAIVIAAVLASALTSWKSSWFAVATHVALLQLATMSAWSLFLRGKSIAIWNPTPRPPFGQSSSP